MATHIMRKYRRWIIVFGVSLAAIPLVFYTGSGVPGRDDADLLGESVAKVGNIPISVGDFLNYYNIQYDAARTTLQPGAEMPDARELMLTGWVDSYVLDPLINDALIRTDTGGRVVNANTDYLAQKLKEKPWFYTPEGQFDSRYFNQWVENNVAAKSNWNEIYAQISREVNFDFFMAMTSASTRVLEADLRSDYERQNTKLKVSFVTVDLAKEFTEEELKERYEQAPDLYQTEVKRIARFIALPLGETEDEKKVQMDRVRELAAAAKEGKDLSLVAQTEGLELHTSSAFTYTSLSIEGVDPDDIFAFRRALTLLSAGDVSQAIRGRIHGIVAQIHEVVPARQQTFEEAREDVEFNATVLYKASEEFHELAHGLTEEIEAYPGTLEEAVEAFPDTNLEIRLSPFFAYSDQLYAQNILWDPDVAHGVLAGRELGAKTLIKDVQGTHYVLELAEREAPGESFWTETWPKEREAYRQAALDFEREARADDYIRHLRRQADELSLVQIDYPAIQSLLGFDREPTTTAAPPVDVSPSAPVAELTDPTVVTIEPASDTSR